MFSYIMLGTNDPIASYNFYAPLMEVLGYPLDGRGERGAAWGTFKGNNTTGLCVGVPFDNLPATMGNGVMVALNTTSKEMVNQLYALAMQNGGQDEGSPGYRPHYGNDFYSAYVRDLDKNKLAFVYYDPERIEK